MSREIILILLLMVVFETSLAAGVPRPVSVVQLITQQDEFFPSPVLVIGFLRRSSSGSLLLYDSKEAAQLEDAGRAIAIDEWKVADHLDLGACDQSFVKLIARFQETDSWGPPRKAITEITVGQRLEIGTDNFPPKNCASK